MERRDFYKGQRVVQSELDAAFGDAEQADWNKRVDDAVFGVIAGLVPSLGSAPSMAITKGIAYDQLGRRIRAFSDGASSKSQSYATATDGTPTSVTAGNERWIAVYASFGRLALDSRTDGDGNTVYFDQPENLHDGTVGVLATAGLGGAGVDKFLIVAGTAASTGTAVKPTLLTNAILLCDIKRTPSDASNVLDTTRRQLLGIPDTAAPGSGLAVLMSALSSWLGGRTFPAQATLNAALSKLITDLAATSASDDGAERIGAEGHGFVSAGSIRSQLNAMIDEMARLSVANHFLGNQTIDGSVSVGTTLGVTGVSTLGDRVRITPTTATPAIDAAQLANNARQELFEFDFVNTSLTASKLRVYLNNKPLFTGGPRRSLLITYNAKWDGSLWNVDTADGPNPGSPLGDVTAVEIGGYRNAGHATTDPVHSGGLVFYRVATGAAITGLNATSFADSEWTGASANVLDCGRVFQTDSNTDVQWSNSGYYGTNLFNLFNGEFVIGTPGTVFNRVTIGLGSRGPAVAGQTVGGVVALARKFTGTPSSISLNTTVSVNAAAPAVVGSSAAHIEWSSATAATAEYRLAGGVTLTL